MCNSTKTASVVIVGPNLQDQSKGSFHVHSEGCRDLHKAVYRFEEIDWVTEVSSVQEIVEAIYGDIIDENEDTTWEDYRSDIHILPCVKLGDTK